MEDSVRKKLLAKQSAHIKKYQRNFSFSKVVNDVLKIGLQK